MTTKAVVVLSGGQDSTTCAFWAKSVFDEVHCVTFDYEQRHRREIQSAEWVAKLIGADSHEVIRLGPILKGRSPLTDPTQSLEKYTDYQSMDKIIGDRVELTFVPMRNALFLTLAANRAVCLDAYNLVTGVCQADNANYPDCRRVFIDFQAHAIAEALGIARFDIHTPLMDMSKHQSILFSHQFSDAYVALAFTHTAYDGQYPPIGYDHATTLRAEGFRQSGYPDPLVIRAFSEGLMTLPDTKNYTNTSFNELLINKITAMKVQLS